MRRDGEGRLWHVVLTVGGEPVEPLLVRAAINRLEDERPFIDSLTFGATEAELQYWDEGETLIDVASLALRLWNEHRATAGLPPWDVTGLEIVSKPVWDARFGPRSGTAGAGLSGGGPPRSL